MWIWLSILGSVIGAIVGLVGGLILGFIVEIVFFVATGTSGNESAVGEAIWLLSVLVCAIVGFLIPYSEEQETRRKKAAEKAAEKNKTITNLNELVSTTLDEFSQLPILIPATEEQLDRAEEEFKERAFAPFWDEIEGATKKLAMYENGIRTIAKRAKSYDTEAAKISGSCPPFPHPPSPLPDARPTADRLARVVRRAQKDFEFATIYEQRKTNQVLVEGFNTLGSTIYALGDTISKSMGELSESLHVSIDRLIGQITVEAEARRSFEEDALKEAAKQTDILDNIQRGKKP